MIYFYSTDAKNDPVLVKNVVLAVSEDYEPYYYIKFVLTNGNKTTWKYGLKEARDRDIVAISEKLLPTAG